MSDVTRILNALSNGEEVGTDELFAAVYDELRGMAEARMAREQRNHTLQPTALVNEAYLRLAGNAKRWENRAHFFGAAAEAMRRILIESARRKGTAKRGAGEVPTVFDERKHDLPLTDEKLLQVHEVLDELEVEDAQKARIVKLRFFVGLSLEEIAEVLGVNERTVRRHWELARVWLYRAIRDG